MDKIDELELAMQSLPPVECPLLHLRTPGMYTRQIFMPAGSLVTSKIHRTTHPFVVSLGKVSVYSENNGEEILEAPYTGITTPGTRRVLYCHTDVIWTTFHVADDTETIEDIEYRILEPYVNELLKVKVDKNENIGHISD